MSFRPKRSIAKCSGGICIFLWEAWVFDWTDVSVPIWTAIWQLWKPILFTSSPNKNKTTLYIGVTNDLQRRFTEHQEGIGSKFTKRYNIHYLIYYEKFHDVTKAIAREKQLKRWSRMKKEKLIETANSDWKFIESKNFSWKYGHLDRSGENFWGSIWIWTDPSTTFHFALDDIIKREKRLKKWNRQWRSIWLMWRIRIGMIWCWSEMVITRFKKRGYDAHFFH